MLNWSKIIGFSLIAMAVYEMMKLIVAYASGKMEFWPSGVEIRCCIDYCAWCFSGAQR